MLEIKRTSILLKPNPKRIICQFLKAEDEASAKNIIDRVMLLNKDQILQIHDHVYSDFNERHKNFKGFWKFDSLWV